MLGPDEHPSNEDWDRLFHALADATRRDIVLQVMQQGQSISSLAGRYAMSFAAVQKHVAVLERAGLVRKERRGREQHVHGEPVVLHKAARLLESYELLQRHRTAAIEELLEEEP
ncbi:winged helix-turn-helix domain-containing protein [Pseudonocardia xishanensis]|uniref:Metalloregulator ArsR/SmtB family transcription factor n=1 Tax=Pseudonocardia xishanensis TaxID=630995 RepID=A0ABP8S0T9_9PSEU